MKINIKRVFAIGITFGLFILAAKILLNLDDSSVLSLYLFMAAAMVIISLWVNISRQRKFMKKLLGLQTILTEDKNFDLFIAENEKLLKTLKSPYNKSLCIINMSVGYCEKQDFAKAKEVLLRVQENEIKGINKTIYHIDLVYLNFLLGDNETAAADFDKYKNEFAKLENHASLGKNIAVNKIYYHIAKGENARALELLNAAKTKYNDGSLDDDFDRFDKVLNKTKD